MPSNRQWEQFFNSGTIPKDLHEPLAIILTLVILSTLLYCLVRTQPPAAATARRQVVRVPDEQVVVVPLLPTQMQHKSPVIGEEDRNWNIGFLIASSSLQKFEICIGGNEQSGFAIIDELKEYSLKDWNVTILVQVQQGGGEQFVE
jgi:hypothetical protein